VRVGEFQALGEDLGVVGVRVGLVVQLMVMEAAALFEALFDGLVRRGAPVVEFVGVEEVFENEKAVVLIGGDLLVGKPVVHGESAAPWQEGA
jgi:hypothetical protein